MDLMASAKGRRGLSVTLEPMIMGALSVKRCSSSPSPSWKENFGMGSVSRCVFLSLIARQLGSLLPSTTEIEC